MARLEQMGETDQNPNQSTLMIRTLTIHLITTASFPVDTAAVSTPLVFPPLDSLVNGKSNRDPSACYVFSS